MQLKTIASQRGLRLKQARKDRHLTARELEHRLAEANPNTSLNENKLRNYEHGKALLRKDEAEEIAAVLNVDPADLLIDDPAYPSAHIQYGEDRASALPHEARIEFMQGMASMAALTLYDGAMAVVRELRSIADELSGTVASEANLQRIGARLDEVLRRSRDLVFSPLGKLGKRALTIEDQHRRTVDRNRQRLPEELCGLARHIAETRKRLSDGARRLMVATTANVAEQGVGERIDIICNDFRSYAQSLEQAANRARSPLTMPVRSSRLSRNYGLRLNPIVP